MRNGIFLDKLLTNNPLAAERYRGLDVQWIDGPARDVLTAARDYVHLGHALLTHPLASSIPRKDSPFKSIIISGTAGQLNYDSLRIIENAIEAYKIGAINFNIHQTVAEDFMLIDCDVISAAAEKSSKMKEGML